MTEQQLEELYPTSDYRRIITLNGTQRKFCPVCSVWHPLYSFPTEWYGEYPLCVSCAPKEVLAKNRLPESKQHLRKKKKLIFHDAKSHDAQLEQQRKAQGIIDSHGGLERTKDLRRRVMKYQGNRCVFLNTPKIQNHHILSFKHYKQYADDEFNCIMLDNRLHGFVTYAGSYHYIRFFFDFLDANFHTDHSNYPCPDFVVQRNLLTDISGVNLDDFYHGTIV